MVGPIAEVEVVLEPDVRREDVPGGPPDDPRAAQRSKSSSGGLIATCPLMAELPPTPRPRQYGDDCCHAQPPGHEVGPLVLREALEVEDRRPVPGLHLRRRLGRAVVGPRLQHGDVDGRVLAGSRRRDDRPGGPRSDDHDAEVQTLAVIARRSTVHPTLQSGGAPIGTDFSCREPARRRPACHLPAAIGVGERAAMDDFAGRIAVVTGAGSGIGAALAVGFAEAGATVVAVDIDGRAADATAAAIGGAARGIAVDVADPGAVESLAQQVFADHGCVDLLVNNAGVFQGGLMWERTLTTTGGPST